MPYNSNSALPPSVRGALPDAAQIVFRNVVNNRLAAGQSDQRAFRQGWAVVHRNWRKPVDGGKWQPKADKAGVMELEGVVAGKRRASKGYPEYDENQPRAADGTWGGGSGGGGSASGGASSSGESGWRRAGRYTLTAGALLAAAALGVVAAPHAVRLARSVGRRVGLGRATRTASVATASKLKDTIKARDVIMAARAKSAERQAYFTSQLAQGSPNRARVKELNAQIKRHTSLQSKFDAELRQLERQIKTLRRSKKRAMHKRHAPLYVCRYVVNANDFVAWAKSQGFTTVLDPKDLHVTIAYSRKPLDWPEPQDNRLVLRPSSNRTVERLGDDGAVVLRFNSGILTSRWEELRKKGASWNHEDEYNPHVTISYRVPEDFDLSSVKPYDGELIFGPEDVRPFGGPDEHVEKVRPAITFSKALARRNRPDEIKFYPCPLSKAKDKGLGLVFGWSIISSENGKPYYDTQGDHIPEDSMLNAATEFMQSKRSMKIMHSGKSVGKVVFAWPMTQEIAEAMGVKGGRTGLMIAVKPDNPNVLERFREGKYSGFSIGGNRLVDEDEEDYTAGKSSAVTFKAAWEESKHPRDGKGQFSAAGAAAAVGAAGALALGGAAGLGVRGARYLLPQIRRAVLAMRMRRARSAARGAAASFYSRGDFGRRRGDLGAAMGAITAAGRENPAVNALRGQRGIQSLAARRRAARRRFAATGVNRPTSLWD